jgi:hypothetical protein
MSINLDRRRFLGAAGLTAASVPLASRLSAAAAADPWAGGDPVIVARGTGGRKAFFADQVLLDDGRILAVYRESVAHIAQDGRIMLVESADGGRTWSTPRVVVDSTVDERDPKIMQMRDGTVLMNFFRTDWTGYPPGPVTLVGTFVTRSADGGRSWSEPVQVGSRMSGPSDVLVGIYHAGHAATHGPIVELDNGDLLVPLYGTLPTGGDGPASVVRSTDGGRTWPKENESFFGFPSGFSYQEPNVSVLRHGLLLAVIRSSRNIAYVSWSHDDGHTWTPPRDTGLPASSHHQLVTHNGDVLLTYGDLSGQFGPGRPTVGRILQHPERGVDAKRDVLLYDAADNGAPTADQANPSSVELRPGHFLTMTSDPYLAAIVAVHSRTRDYLGRSHR